MKSFRSKKKVMSPTKKKLQQLSLWGKALHTFCASSAKITLCESHMSTSCWAGRLPAMMSEVCVPDVKKQKQLIILSNNRCFQVLQQTTETNYINSQATAILKICSSPAFQIELLPSKLLHTNLRSTFLAHCWTFLANMSMKKVIIKTLLFALHYQGYRFDITYWAPIQQHVDLCKPISTLTKSILLNVSVTCSWNNNIRICQIYSQNFPE